MDNKKPQNQLTQQNGVATKIDALYNWLSYDLQALKKEIFNELKYSSMQSGALHKSIQEEAAKSAKETAASVQLMVQELKYGYKQNQAIYDGLSGILNDEVVSKLDTAEGKLALLEEIDKALAEIKEKIATFDADSLVENIRDSVLAGIPQNEEIDYEKIGDTVVEKTSEQNRQVLEAVAAIPVAENVDYARITEEVSEKVLEMLQEAALTEKKEIPEIDYDRIIYGAAEKVVESLPYPEKVDYRRMDENFMKAAETVKSEVNADELVEKLLAAFNVDALAEKVAEKLQAPEIDYDRLADMVATRLAPADEACEVVIDEEGVKEIAAGVSELLDVEAVATKVAEKLSEKETSYELLMEEEDVQQIADRVAEILHDQLVLVPCDEDVTVTEEPVAEETPVEEAVEEPVEELVEEVVEEVAEEVVEEPVEEAQEVVEETIEEPVEEVKEEVVPETKEEIAVAIAEHVGEDNYEEVDNQLVDAETGLVIRLKRSFTAKLKQSETDVKDYYSRIKNSLTGYKKINSNVSWHGDRFNYGRDTVAKMNICGKTLCFYLALDPADPEFKTTVYHQKDVGAQKAYENTPFMVKVKSDAAVKKAVRLVEALATKLEAVKDEKFSEVDYKEEFAYETTKQLLSQGLIKVTKEKKVELDF